MSNENNHLGGCAAANGDTKRIDLTVEKCHIDREESAEGQAVATRLSVLIVEDSAPDVELALYRLSKSGFDLAAEVVQTADDFKNKIRGSTYDVVLADYRLPGWNGTETVEILRKEQLDVPVIVVSGALGELKAVECIKQGAADYVLKDHLARLPVAVRRALQEKKLRDDRRKAQEELARSNRDLEQFAYVASHDLQEPLRMVATYTQLLAEHYKGKLDADADKYIHYAVDGALRMQTLVQDLLAFSRVGRGGINLQSVRIDDVLGIATKNLESIIKDNFAVITSEAPPLVNADRSMLVQLFQNLIGNAIKFRGPAQPIIHVSAKKNGKQWVFSVQDNGIGIAPEHAETIFVIFKRLHTHAEYPGSGIGLSICKKIIEQHNGRIWVESQPGHGSTFKFTLPITTPRRTYDHASENRS